MPVYLYGLIGARRRVPPDLRGIGGAALRRIRVGAVAVVASDLEDEAAELDLQDIAAHAAVIDALFAGGPVLPFRVGVAADEAALPSELGPRVPAYAERLGLVKGHCELEVRARLEEEDALKTALARSAEARTLARLMGPRSSFDEQLRLGEILGSELEAQKRHAAASLDERLASVAVEVSVMAPAEHQAFRAAYLVPTARAGELCRLARAVEKEVPALRVEVTGPVPPYSFAEPPDG